jgi:CheY-like chemotaxis protein
MRILILEDDRATAQLLGMLLTSSGHTIVHALDGTEGLKQLRVTACDLVISDVQMVPMDGFEFLATARSEFPRLLVVLASACADLHVRIEQQAHKPFDVVHKPFRIEEVRRVLGRAEEALAVQASVARAAAGTGARDTGGAAPDAAAAGLARLYPGPAYAQARAGLLRAMAHAGNALLVAEPGVLPAEVLDLWRGAAGSGGPWRVVDVGRDAEACARAPLWRWWNRAGRRDRPRGHPGGVARRRPVAGRTRASPGSSPCPTPHAADRQRAAGSGPAP